MKLKVCKKSKYTFSNIQMPKDMSFQNLKDVIIFYIANPCVKYILTKNCEIF